jgi:outer membrane immunogenic protein
MSVHFYSGEWAAGVRTKETDMKFMLSTALLLASGALPGVVYAEPFNGPYVGVQAGLNHDKVGTADTTIGDLAIGRSKDSFIGGIYGGYDLKVASRVVIGAEAGFNVATSDTITRTGTGSLAQINPSYAFDLSARAGYLLTDNTLFYVRGGYDNMRAKTTSTLGNVTLRDKDTFDGWMVGGGVERAITNAITARLEYRYSDLSGGHGKFDRHQALVGVAYHF